MGEPRQFPPSDLPPDFEPRMPDDIEVRYCYRHPDRETGVSCSNCGRPICHDCMIPAAVGFRCPECVREQSRGERRARVVTRGEMRSRWSRAGVGSRIGGVTRTLIILNIGIYVVEALYAALLGFSPLRALLGGVPGRVLFDMGGIVPAAVADGDLWRLGTAMFLHAGLFHILFNMYALFIGGSFLEMLAGRAKYLAVYFVAGLAGNVLVFVLAAPLSITVGASTAIFGIFGALFAYSLHFRDTLAGQALRSMGFVILINLVITFAVPGISWQGHIGGLIGGVAAVEALTLFGRRDLRAPFGRADAAALAGVVAVLVALVVWRVSSFPVL
jgi:membrane associated rhomboid family serine protease